VKIAIAVGGFVDTRWAHGAILHDDLRENPSVVNLSRKG